MEELAKKILAHTPGSHIQIQKEPVDMVVIDPPRVDNGGLVIHFIFYHDSEEYVLAYEILKTDDELGAVIELLEYIDTIATADDMIYLGFHPKKKKFRIRGSYRMDEPKHFCYGSTLLGDRY